MFCLFCFFDVRVSEVMNGIFEFDGVKFGVFIFCLIFFVIFEGWNLCFIMIGWKGFDGVFFFIIEEWILELLIERDEGDWMLELNFGFDEDDCNVELLGNEIIEFGFFVEGWCFIEVLSFLFEVFGIGLWVFVLLVGRGKFLLLILLLLWFFFIFESLTFKFVFVFLELDRELFWYWSVLELLLFRISFGYFIGVRVVLELIFFIWLIFDVLMYLL